MIFGIRSFFAIPETIRPLIASRAGLSWQFLIFFSSIYLSLNFLAALVSPPTSVFDFPILSFAYLAVLWIVVLSASLLVMRSKLKQIALVNTLIWFFAASTAVLFSKPIVWLLVGGEIPIETSFQLLTNVLSSFMNLAAYAMVFAGIVQYRSVAKSLRMELDRLEALREGMNSQLESLKTSYVAEVEQRVRPVVNELELSLASADADAVVSQARAAIEDVVLPLSKQLNTPSELALPQLPSLPKRSLYSRVARAFSNRVLLRDTQVPILSALMFLLSIAPAIAYFYAFSGYLAALAIALVILAIEFLRAVVIGHLQTNLFVAFAVILFASLITAVAAVALLGGLIAHSDIEVNAFIGFGTWLVVFLIPFMQLINLTSLAHLSRVEMTQRDFIRTITKRDSEIRHIQHRITQSVHSDVQGKLRAVLLRIKNGGLTPEALPALQADLEHVKEVLSSIGSAQKIDLQIELDQLSQFWEGICDLRVTSETEVLAATMADSTLANNAFEVISEAVANAMKHAEAKQVIVELSVASGQLQVRVINEVAKTPTNSASGGIGSSVFDKNCSSWRVEQNEGTYIFIGNLPL
jgi:signal transduction histidine kinase